jgi:uncharacterized damage-inducible protein DinB
MKRTLPILAMALLAAPALAQSPAAAPAGPALGPALSGLQMPYMRIKDILVRAAEKMPEESYGFKPTPEVKSFGEIVGHVADANAMLCGMALGEDAKAGDNEKTKTTKADLVKAVKDSYLICDKAFAQPDAEAAKPLKMFGMETTRFAAIGLALGHDWEHYGNLVTYMRIRGLVPPSSEPRPAMPAAPAAPKK